MKDFLQGLKFSEADIKKVVASACPRQHERLQINLNDSPHLTPACICSQVGSQKLALMHRCKHNIHAKALPCQRDNLNSALLLFTGSEDIPRGAWAACGAAAARERGEAEERLENDPQSHP